MEKNKNVKEVTIKLEGKIWQEALDKAFIKANKTVKIDGFRPGKAPKDVFLKKYGKESLYLDAADLVLNDAYGKMIDDNKDLEIVAQPEVALRSIDDNGVEFMFTLTLRPEVKLGKYKKLGVKKEAVKVSKEEIDNALEETRQKYSENIIKDGNVENGDIAIIDFEGFKDGVPFDGGKGENYSLTIGSNTFIPGFEEQLIGMKKGEEKDIQVTFPKDYHAEDLKGKEVTFKVKVNDIKTIKVPELDKDFFDDLGLEGINSEESLRKQLEENIKVHKEHHAENDFIDALLTEATSNMETDIPDAMIKDELERMLKQYEENLKMQGITLEQFFKFTNSDLEALKEQMQPEALKRIKERLLLEEIKKIEKIEVTEAEAIKEAQDLAKKYNMEKDEFLRLFGGIEMVKYDLEMRKALEVLKDNN